MSTKASSLNARANNSPTNSTMNTSTKTTTVTPTVVKIKKESPSDEIKEYAESTMNELLGWYGFDSVDRLDISAKSSKLSQTVGIISGQQHQQQQPHHHQTHNLEKRRSRASRAASLIHMHQQQQQNEHLRTLNNNHNNSNRNSNSNNSNNINDNNSSNNRKTSLNCNNNNYRGNDSTTSDHDTRSSRDDDSKSPNSTGKTYTPATNIIDDKLVDYENCCWCRRPVPENAPEFLTTSDGPRYCSESCFTQSRRASFKKAKTCDWCKHVRHAVSYVDFQDGASQLQFCSDKCLNQYKMQIFCKETQAHLDMNPHLKEQGLEAANNGANLITPDLWLRNCRSRSASPASTISISPVPTSQANMGIERANLSSGTISPTPRLAITTTTSLPHNSNTSHKPLISVAPVSKLMSKSPNSILPNRQSPKPNRKKRPVRACASAEIANTRTNEVKTNSSASLAVAGNKSKPLIASSLNQTNTQTLTQFATSCVQDLHMNVPPLSPMMGSPSSQPSTPHSLPPTLNRGPASIPPAFFATPPNSQCPQSPQPVAFTSQAYQQRPAFLHNPNGGFLPRFLGNFNCLPPPPTHTHANLMPPDLTAFNALIGTPPPVTVMVPYPVIIPLPIPIPVPLPVVDFYKAYMTPEERRKYDQEQEIKKETETKTSLPSLPDEAEEPLDFTKTKELEVEEEDAAKNTFICSTKEQDLLAPTSNKNSKEVEAAAPINSALTEDSQTNPKQLHSVSISKENENNDSVITTSKLKADFLATSQNINENSNEVQSNAAGEETNPKLPKLKITRLQTKRTLIQTKESECSRPLRKRKRIIDCDFQKLGTSNSNSKEASELADELHTATESEQTNKGQNINSNNTNNKK